SGCANAYRAIRRCVRSCMSHASRQEPSVCRRPAISPALEPPVADRAQRIVVITGGSAGVGRATARAFARGGADVALIARGEERLNAACDEIRATGRRAIAIQADVADADAIEAAAQRAEAELGPIDCWV